MNHKEDITKAIESLKDFQKSTVDYVINRMYQGQNKFLVADEVGLGKTIVARGIIAKLYEKEYSLKKDFQVIYICSNQALAGQNLSKLNFFSEKEYNIIDYNDQDDRLTSMAYEPINLQNQARFKIKALTPATSFDGKRRAGRGDERVLLYRLLLHVPELQTRLTSLRWFLRGGQQMGEANWSCKTEIAFEYERHKRKHLEVRPIRNEVYLKFNRSLKRRLSDDNQKKIFGKVTDTRTILSALLHILEENKQNRSYRDGRDIVFKPYYSLIAELRLQLSYVCKEYLKADIFILDEFQKFSQLIKAGETENKGEEIARAIFSETDSRVLLLSATPFKAYTNSFDEHHGDNHYKEFIKVLKFLQKEKESSFWQELEKQNAMFFDGIKNFKLGKGFTELVKIKNSLQETYRQAIVRTERSLVENSGNIFREKSCIALEVQPDDINDFIAIDEIILESNRNDQNKLHHPVEYVKSSPFPLSFLQDYDHHKVLKTNYENNHLLKQLIKKSKKAFVPVERINVYKALLPEKSINEPNPKLRLLYDETVRNLGYRLLWVPPCLKYYQTKGGAYANAEHFTKTLIFSAWRMVPKMISALVSYEAERLSVGKLFDQEDIRAKYSYRDKNRYPRPLLTFRKTETGLSGMNNLMLAYPSIFLSGLYNPLENLVAQKDLSRIRQELRKKIISRLKQEGILEIGDNSGNTQKWDWLAVLFLDKCADNQNKLADWLNNTMIGNLFDGENDTDNKFNDTHRSVKEIHFKEIKDYFLTGTIPQVGRLNKTQLEKLADHLVELSLGAPGICALRAMNQSYPGSTHNDKMTAALDIGMGMISMFNKPESIAVVKVSANDNFYYQNVLSYCVDGNIQAMLDEFLYQLSDSAGIKDCLTAANLVKNILMVGSSKVDVITETSIKDDNHFSMRTHYAVPFGSSAANDLKNGNRQIKVREAFNSPFRPFVLSSTSIGQEGLDFHFYCKKIIHWNLPNNPIDLEQREGRIKRYKSLAVRKSIAEHYKQYLNRQDINGKIWDALFNYASNEKKEENKHCDLIPFWHLNKEDAKIESLIPLYQYSKDVFKYQYTKDVLTNYRLTFGQPNQQDLIEALSLVEEEQKSQLMTLLINLCPIQFLDS